MSIALQGASLTPREGAEPISGEQLKEMADQHTIAYNIIQRISRMIDMDVLSAIMNGAKLNLNSQEEAEQSAQSLAKTIHDPTVEVKVENNENGESSLSVIRTHYGNAHVTRLDKDFLYGNDYRILEKTATAFLNLIGPGAMITRGEGDRHAPAGREKLPSGDAMAAFRSRKRHLQTALQRSG